MRKIGVIVICLLLAVSLAACKMPEIDLPELGRGDGITDGTVDTPVTQIPSSGEESSQPDTQTESDEMTFDAFIEKVGGVWILDGSASLLYDEEYTYTFCTISKEAFGGGVYPGGADRPAKITDCKAAGENVYELSLLYEAGEYMGDVLPEEHATLTVTMVEEGKISMRFDLNESYLYQYAGVDLDQAKQAAAQMVAQ